MIYFIRNADSGAIKIGTAVDVMGRLKTLQTGSEATLELMCAIPGDREAERKLHRRFLASHIRGEWFRPTTELANLIEGLAATRASVLPSPTEEAEFRHAAAIEEARIRANVGFPATITPGLEPWMTGARDREFSYQVMPDVGYDVGDRLSAKFWWWHVGANQQWFADPISAADAFIDCFIRWRNEQRTPEGRARTEIPPSDTDLLSALGFTAHLRGRNQ